MTTTKSGVTFWACAVALLIAVGASAETYYASPTGSSSGKGTYADPWDITTAFANDDIIQPGDTLFLLAGTYGTGGSTNFICSLDGTQANPITVAGFPGARVTIDGGVQTLSNDSSYITFRDLEVTNSSTERVQSTVTGRIYGFSLASVGSSLVNCVIHDTGHPGVAYWGPCLAAQINGCLIYGTGYYDVGNLGTPQSPVVVGSAIYTQNDSGVRLLKDIITFRNFTCGPKPYSSPAGSAHVDGFHIVGNTAFDNILYNIMVSGSTNAPNDLEVTDNCLWRRPDDPAESMRIGYSNYIEDAEVTGNYVVSGENTAIRVRKVSDLTVTGNTFIAQRPLAQYKQNASVVGETWNNNTYCGPGELSSPHTLKVGTHDWGVVVDVVIVTKDGDLTQEELDTIAEDVLEEEEAAPTDTFVFDAEAGELSITDPAYGGWNIIADANAINGYAIQADESLGHDQSYGKNGIAKFAVNFDSTGSYEVYYRARSEDMDDDQLLNNEDNLQVSRGDMEGVFSDTTFTQSNRIRNETYYWRKASDAYLGERFEYTVADQLREETPFIEEDVDEYDFADWQTATGFDASSSLIWPLPTTNKIVVRPNDNEDGRGHVTIYNWAGDSSVDVDLSTVLDSGDAYEIMDSQNYFGSPVASGTYTSGTVSIPMNQTTVAAPIGDTPSNELCQSSWAAYTARCAPTAPDFGCFVVRLTSPTVAIIDAGEPVARELNAEPGKFTVRRTGSTASAVTVNYTVSGTATSGTDYIALSGSVYIPAGESTGTIVVTPYNDASQEDDETVIVTLATGTGYTLHPSAVQATVTIDNRYVIADHTLVFEAEDATLSVVDSEIGGWNVISDSDSFGGQAIQADESLYHDDMPDGTNGIAEIEVTFPEAGTYELYYRARTEDMDSDDLYNNEDNVRLSRGDLEDVFSATNFVQSNRISIPTYKWFQVSDAYLGERFVYTVEAEEVDVPQTLQIITHDWGVTIDAIVISKTDDLTDEELDDIAEQVLTVPDQGTLAFNLEDFALDVADPQQEGWNVLDDPDAYGNRALETDPSLGSYNYNGEATLNIVFSEAGTYELYYRARSEDMNDDELLNIEDEMAFSRGDLENVFSTSRFRQSNRIRTTTYLWFKASDAVYGERFVYTVEDNEVLVPQLLKVYTTDWGVKADAIVFSKDDSLTSTELDAIAAERLE